MAFDGVITKAIVSELNTCLINGKINKIFEPNKNEILLGIYSGGKNYALNISIDSVNYRINLTTNSKPNPQNVLNFCMVLRKHLISGVIKRIYTDGLERIIFIDIDCRNELNDLITKTLVIELMGKHSNVILLNQNSIVIDSLRHLNKFDNSTRDIFPGSKYTNIITDKLDFYNVDFDEFYESLELDNLNINNKNLSTYASFSISSTISKNYNGFGKNNLLYLLDYLNISDSSSNIEDIKKVFNYIKNILSDIEKTSGVSCMLQSSQDKKDFFLISSKEDSTLSVNFAIDDFYYNKERTETFKTYKEHILKLVLNQVTKLKDKIANVDKKIKECSKMDMYKLYGELITANLYRIEDYSQESVTLENYYDNNNLITIPLDNSITPSKNAKNFFKKYRKLQNTIAIVNKQKELFENELIYLDSIVYELEASNTIEDINNIYSEISDNLLYSKNSNTVNNNLYTFSNTSKSPKNKNISNLQPTKYIIDGFTVLVGKNNKQNDYLTCKLAQNSDVWFHTKDTHGSHVILKLDNLPEDYTLNTEFSKNSSTSLLDISKSGIPDSLLYKCASLAAYFSKARMSQNVAVDYTFVKYVKKPTGAKPGMVVYTNNKTLYVNPSNY